MKEKKIDWDNMEDSFIEIYDSDNLKFTENDLWELMYEPVERINGDNRRWSRTVETIVKMKDRYFSICHEEGLTESQESYINGQPLEVVRKEKQVTKVYWEYKGE